MYSGIVEAVATVKKIVEHDGCKDFIIHAPQVLADCHIGDSLGVNGVCLTVTKFDSEQFHVTAVPETLSKTNLDLLQQDSQVNVERCMKLSDRLGGHFIQGHVDGMIEVLDIQSDGAAQRVKFSMPDSFKPYIVTKGFVALDGMSITVVEAAENWFIVTFIPHTIENTIVHNYQIGTKVNLETDMLAKHVAKLMGKL